MQNFTSVDLMILSDSKLFLVIFSFFFSLEFGIGIYLFPIYSIVSLYVHCKYVAHSLCYTRTITPTFDHQFTQYSIFYYHTRKTRWLIYICDIRSLRFESFSNWKMEFVLMECTMSSKSIASKIHFNVSFVIVH